MAGDTSSFHNFDFGVVSNSTLAAQQVEDFLDGDTKTKVKEEKVKEEVKEESKEKAPKIGPFELSDLEKESEDDTTEDSDTTDTEEEVKEEKSQDSPFQYISQQLFKMGVFTLDDEEDENSLPSTEEEFASRFDYEKKKGVGDLIDKWLGSQTEEARDIFQKVLIDKVDPKKYLQSFTKLKDIANLDLTDEYNQERIVEELFRQDGRKNPKALVQRAKELGTIEEDAKEAQSILLEREQASIEAETQKVKQDKEQEVKKRNHYLQSVQKILSEKLIKKEFDGIPVTKQFAESIAGYITQDKYQSQGGNLTEFDNDLRLLNEPENYELKVKVAMLLKMVKEDPTLSKIKKVTISQESGTLFGKIREMTSKTEKTTPPKQKGWY
jgi:hypothetical protein